MAEAAGIALAAFPLCIELIKYYCRGVATLKDMREYHKLLKEYQRELDMEFCKFSNSLYNVFGNKITPEDCEHIFQNPKEAEEHLKARFHRPSVAENFVKAVDSMREQVTQLQQQFSSIDEDALDTSTKQDTPDKIFDGPQNRHRVRKNLRKRFRIAMLNDTYTERMNQIRFINADIETILNGAQRSMQSPSAPQYKIPAITRHYERVQTNAKSIFDALKQRIQAPHGCGNGEHRVGLCLEKRIGNNDSEEVVSGIPKQRMGSKHDIKLSFSILVHLAEARSMDGECGEAPVLIWRELAIDAGEDTPDDQVQKMGIEVAQPKRTTKVTFARNKIAVHTAGGGVVSQTSVSTSMAGGRSPASPVFEPAEETGSGSQSQTAPKNRQGADSPKQSPSGVNDGAVQPMILPQDSPMAGGRFGMFFGSLTRKLEFKASRRRKPSLGSVRPSGGFFKSFFTSVSSKKSRNTALVTSDTDPGGPSTKHPQQSPPIESATPPLASARISLSPEEPVHPTTNLRESQLDAESHRDVIPDICLKIQDCASSREFLGLLTVGGSSRKYRVCSMPLGGCLNIPITPGASEWLSEPVSLWTLLQHGRSFNLTRTDSLLIGIKLASSVIQLHHTWWLGEQWSKRDIIFFAHPQTQRLLKQKPIVLHSLRSTVTNMQPQSADVRGTCRVKSKPLFLLGLVLWELWYEKCLENFEPEEIGPGGVDHETQSCGDPDYLQWEDAKLLMKAYQAFNYMANRQDAPACYIGAVQQCLFGGIQLSTDETLNIATAWEKVVWPLEKLYEVFNNPV